LILIDEIAHAIIHPVKEEELAWRF
jgi:hypothetical protein